MSFMSAGMRIRGNNMQLSSVNPQITRGLAQVSYFNFSLDTQRLIS
jgi:hypothetical protein